MQFFAEAQTMLVHLAKLSGAGLAILVGAVVAYVCLLRGLKTLESRRHLPPRMIHTLRRSALWLVLFASTLMLLQSMDVLHSVFAAVSGILALLAIGFVAVWSVLSNTLCSLILLIVRPFRVGDTIGFPPDEFRGRVVNFNMIFTTLETEDQLLLQVPNNVFFQRPILRKKGSWQIGLDEQLYQRANATAARSEALNRVASEANRAA